MADKIYIGDALTVLKTLPSDSIHMCCTSPPYWGLRDYGTATWEGGDPGCDHNPQKPDGGGRADRSLPLGRGGVYKERCKCGATRIDSQIGLEATPEAYVEKLVAVFREVRRVLRDDGTLWLNMGDSYNSPGPNNHNKSSIIGTTKLDGQPSTKKIDSLKPKDLVGMPWRVAFALQADGWWLRQDIIWAKPNPMPESVTDRCTKAHEYIFLLTKSARYFYDAEAVREKNTDGSIKRWSKNPRRSPPKLDRGSIDPYDYSPDMNLIGRNLRSVWTITTKPYKNAHFATFPPELPEICIKAGTSEKGCCPECGKPWVRVVEKGISTGVNGKQDNSASTLRHDALKHSGRIGETESTTTGWQPTCAHNLEPVPCVVLDPFAGSGTVGQVARNLGRNFILIELNEKYIQMQENRCEDLFCKPQKCEVKQPLPEPDYEQILEERRRPGARAIMERGVEIKDERT